MAAPQRARFNALGQATAAAIGIFGQGGALEQGREKWTTNNRCRLRVPPLPSSSYTITRDTNEIMTKSKLLRMDNVGIVVESLDDAISFFTELGLTLEGQAMIEGEWAGRITGLGNQSVEVAMMVTPDGHSRLELSRFLTPSVVADHRNAPVNALGYLRAMFIVSDIDETLTRLRKHGAQLVGEVVQFEDSYRLCYIRGPEGLLIGLAEQLGSNR
jgi:catechol 2,3-dioxygenase-like lactoylglutathione lyase family enzyme